jgi:ABC-type spermidine/putrescine transport system permease subunit II
MSEDIARGVVSMNKVKGSWAKIGLLTALACLALGLLYGYSCSHRPSREEGTIIEVMIFVALALGGLASGLLLLLVCVRLCRYLVAKLS